MPCYHPLTGYKASNGGITFTSKTALPGTYLTVPCGRCIGCRVDKAKSWAVRCVHEAFTHDLNCFITLTYNDKFLPADGSLDKFAFQKFMKRLRKMVSSKSFKKKYPNLYRRKIGYFQCGEYGELLTRPHYHACIFNFDFPDRVLWSIRNGVKLYRSALLESLWSDPIFKTSYGFSTIGDVTYESANYVAKYVLKKINGEKAIDHYCGLYPEFVRMSRRPGLGKLWIDTYKSDVYPLDKVLEMSHSGKILQVKPPRYYDKIYDLTNSEKFDKIKALRLKRSTESTDNHWRRLQARETCSKASIARGKRGFENGEESVQCL